MEHENESILGLVCNYQFENGSSQFVFLDVIEGESKPFIDHSRSFFTENFVQARASCNGLILLSGYNGDQSCYYVFNPLTKNITIISQPCIQGHVVRVGLASSGSSQFDVVVIEAGSSSSNGLLEFHVFSSETGKWRVNNPSNLTLPSLPEFEFQELVIPPLYANGAIHWEMGGYLLVYKVHDSHCELFELPNSSADFSWQSTDCRCLCQSGGGRVYYCYIDFHGFHIWELLKENEYFQLYASNDEKKLRWRLVHSVKHEAFVSKYQNLCGKLFEWEPYKITPIAYSEQQQQIMYLQIPGALVSYNFDTGNLGSICTYTYHGMNFNCCLFLSSTTSGLHDEQSGRDLLNSEETELNLPLSEVEKLLIPLSQVLV